MTTETIERTKLTPTIDGDHDKFAHYFTKGAIDKNLLEGKPMTSLCGKTVEVQSDPKGKTVCPTCKEIYDNVVGMNLPGRDGRDS